MQWTETTQEAEKLAPPTEQVKFEGYAVVEIMGHRRAVGYVRTLYFGSVATFHVLQLEQPPEEITIERDMWIEGTRLYAGSRIRIERKKAESFVAASSLYCLTPCTEKEAAEQQAKETVIVFRAERQALAAAIPTEEDNDNDPESEEEEDAEY